MFNKYALRKKNLACAQASVFLASGSLSFKGLEDSPLHL